VITEPTASAAKAALSTLNSSSTIRRPRIQTHHTNHTRGTSWPDPPSNLITSPSAPTFPTLHTLSSTSSGNATPQSHIQLLLYTYKPPQTNPATSQPSPLPPRSGNTVSQHSQVLVNYDSLPWIVGPGDYLEIRKIRRPKDKNDHANQKGMPGKKEREKSGGEALKGVRRGSGRDGYIFMVGEDAVNVPVGQIQVPESVAAAFAFQHRLEIEILRVRVPTLSSGLFLTPSLAPRLCPFADRPC
jgi:hypothetical protein